MSRAELRASRGLRSRTPNSSDSSGMRPAIADRVLPDTHVRRESADVSREVRHDSMNVIAQLVEGRRIRVAPRAHENVARWCPWENESSAELSDSPLQLVAAHGGESEFRNDNRESDMSEGCVEPLDVEQARAHASPRTQHALDVGRLGYASSARKAEPPGGLRRRRTCWEAVPSGACVLSSDGGSKLHVPTSWPCAC